MTEKGAAALVRENKAVIEEIFSLGLYVALSYLIEERSHDELRSILEVNEWHNVALAHLNNEHDYQCKHNSLHNERCGSESVL